MAIDMERIRKQTDYTLSFELEGEEVFSIKPVMSDKTKFIQVMRKKGASDEQKEADFVEFVFDLACKAETGLSSDDKEILKGYIASNAGMFIEQAMIGFKLATKAELDRQKAKVEDKLLEKNLM